MPEDVYRKFKTALDESNKANNEFFNGFSQKLSDIDGETKKILLILEGNPKIPTQKGLSTIVYNNEKRLDNIDKILYKIAGGTVVLGFIFGCLVRYVEKNYL